MTRKHFEIVARVVSRISDAKTRQTVAQSFGAEFETVNSNFDLARFLKACGV